MAEQLKILLLEDNPIDAEIQVEELKYAGYECTWDLVETGPEFEEKLSKGNYNLILADYNLPNYDGLSALKYYVNSREIIPFIIVSGTIGEEIVVECLKSGATDYVLKDRLERLVPVVRRALREYTERLLLEDAQLALRESEERYRRISESVKEVVFCFDLPGNCMEFISPGIEYLLGYTDFDIYDDPDLINKAIYKDDLMIVDKEWSKVCTKPQMTSVECRLVSTAGDIHWVNVNLVSTADENGGISTVEGSVRDITAQKKAEEELKVSRDQLRSLTLHLQSIREEERTQIAREVHDELGQAMTAIKIDLKWVENHLPEVESKIYDKIKIMADMIDSTARRVQKISSELHPGLLHDLGLNEAIEWQISEFSHRTGIICQVEMDDELDIDIKLKTALYRICQEALTNVARHAEASRVKVSLKKYSRKVVFTIYDNGKGIEPELINGNRSLGILGMRERLFPWDGKMDFTIPKDGGTEVTITIPIQPNK